MPLAAPETRAGLGVEADDGHGAQGADGALDLRDGINDVDVPGEGDHGHLVDDLFFYRYGVHDACKGSAFLVNCE